MESKDIKYSLVIGTYNPKKEWLDNALDSAEGLFDETLLVVDGGNIVNSRPYIRTIINAENEGFYKARNTGCRFAKGEWIVSLDDDDEFIRENVLKLKELIEKDADIVCFPIQLFGNQDGYWATNPNMNDILQSNQIPSGSWFKKSVWEKLQGFQLAEGEDWDFWARAHKHGLKFQFVNLPIYRHRMRHDSMSAPWVGDKFLEIKNNVRKNYDKEEI